MNTAIVIRRAQADDFEAVFPLFKQLGETYKPEPYYDERKPLFLSHFQNLLKNPNCTLFVALNHDNLCGFLLGIQTPRWWDHEHIAYIIEALVVDKNFRGSGVGRELLKSFENFVKKNGGQVITLDSSFKRTEAHRFYEQNGYEKDAYSFSKHLA